MSIRNRIFDSRPYGTLVSLATNAETFATPDALGGWKRLAPYGETTYVEKQPDGRLRIFKQIFTRAQAEKMVASFNVIAAKSNFRGLNIFVGHPDGNPVRWPDDARLGGIFGLEARADGLWVNVEWNDKGTKNAEQGYYIYPSPAWKYPRKLAENTGQIIPDVLQSVGLTNTPNINDVDAWTNADLAEAQSETQTQKDTMNIKEMFLQLLGLPEDATEEQIGAAFQAVHAKLNAASALAELERLEKEKEAVEEKAEEAEKALEDSTAENTALNAKLEAAKTDEAKFKAVAINAALDTATNDGRLTAAERGEWQQKLAANYDIASAELEKKTAALNTKPLDKLTPAGGNGDLSSEHGRRTAFNVALDDLMRPVAEGGKGLTSIDAAINHLKTTPEGAALLKAMEPAGA